MKLLKNCSKFVVVQGTINFSSYFKACEKKYKLFVSETLLPIL